MRVWARAVRDAGCRLTYLSSDAVFTGPWLFHAEDSPHHCQSLEAVRLRSYEELVARVVPDALIVRTHAFGWSPDGEGWVESLLGDLEDRAADADPVRHATPILATDLVFAIDSVPAVYVITSDPYLVFATNAFALLGLRALYFVLAGAPQRLVHLGLGLAVILGFIGVKLTLHWAHTEWSWVPEIPTLWSLGVIVSVLVVTTLTSLRATREQAGAEQVQH